MATVNYAEKYAQQVDERFALGALSERAVNREYDWSGVDTVNVYSIPTVAMGNYSMTGTSRYGTPAELGNSVQSMQLGRDRAFTFVIDRRSADDTMMTQEAGRALARQIDEVVVPELDIYRFKKICEGAAGTGTGAVTAANAYESFLNGVNALVEAKTPLTGCVAYITPLFYKAIRMDELFIKPSELGQKMLTKGQVGEIDGIPLVLAPTSYFPASVAFFIVHPNAVVSPVKLAEYKVHDNPPGINGWLVEGRLTYDAFVLDSKTGGIYVHKTA